MWQSIGASKAPVQMRMSPSWRQTDRQKPQRLWKKKKTDRQEATKKKKRSKRAIKNNNREALVSETMTFLPIESDA